MDMNSPAVWWFGLGCLLLVLEMFAGSLFFLWLSAAAFATALASFVFGLGFKADMLVFAAAGVLSFFGWYRFRPRQLDQREGGELVNNRMAVLIGRQAVLQEPVVRGQGRINIDDSWWQVRGDDMPAGTRIQIIGVDGMVLLIKSLELAKEVAHGTAEN